MPDCTCMAEILSIAFLGSAMGLLIAFGLPTYPG